MLHIVNGDSTADKLKQGVVSGDILVWREIYSEGPVFVNPTNPSSRSIRAVYLEQLMGIPQSEYIRTCEAQEQRLSQFKDHDEIVLWFEHDLFDQTMLCYLLYWFSQQSLDRTKLNLQCIGSFPGIEHFRGLGQLSVEQMKTLTGKWHPVNRSELALGKQAWEAYTSADPRQLYELLQGYTSALPYVRDAFLFHLSRFPSVQSGLGIVEKTTLELLNAGLHNPIELFQQAGVKTDRFGMGDLQFWIILRKMSQLPQPLVRIEGTAPIPSYSEPSPEFRHCRIALTDAGRTVLQGNADWVSMNNVDCWLGGVHLQRKNVWRWDEQEKTVVKPNVL